jgi:hypothetical protein
VEGVGGLFLNAISLSAVVYRSRSSIDADIEAQGAKKDERTGQYYFESSEIERGFPRGSPKPQNGGSETLKVLLS